MGDEVLADRIHGFEGVDGRTVTSWCGVEVAMAGASVGPAPQFSLPDVPCLQLLGLAFTCSDGESFVIETYPDGEVFGLQVTPGTVVDPEQYEGIYRARPLPELPVGLIAGDALVVEQNVLAEVTLRVGGVPLVLLSGEVVPGQTPPWRRLDGFVLAVAPQEPAGDQVV